MRNKFKLKGGRIFIENDLSFEERKVQEKMNKWAKGKRGNEGEEIEREERERTKEDSGRRDGGGREEQNFG